MVGKKRKEFVQCCMKTTGKSWSHHAGGASLGRDKPPGPSNPSKREAQACLGSFVCAAAATPLPPHSPIAPTATALAALHAAPAVPALPEPAVPPAPAALVPLAPCVL